MTLPQPRTPAGKRLYKAIGRRDAILAIEQEAAADGLDALTLAQALMTADPAWHGPWSELLNADQDQWLDKAQEVIEHYVALAAQEQPK